MEALYNAQGWKQTKTQLPLAFRACLEREWKANWKWVLSRLYLLCSAVFYSWGGLLSSISTLPYSTLLYSTLIYHCLLYSALLCSALLCSALLCALLYSFTEHSTIFFKKPPQTFQDDMGRVLRKWTHEYCDYPIIEYVLGRSLCENLIMWYCCQRWAKLIVLKI